MVKLKDFEGWAIVVSEYNGTFEAKKGEQEKLSAKTLAELEEFIKRQNAEARHFKPIDVIDKDSDRVGRITSRVKDDQLSVYFTFKNPDEPKEKATRTQSNVETSSWSRSYNDESKTKNYEFVQTTKENLAILAEIHEAQAQREAIDDYIRGLRLTYSDPVTWTMIDKAAGDIVVETKGSQDTDPEGAD